MERSMELRARMTHSVSNSVIEKIERSRYTENHNPKRICGFAAIQFAATNFKSVFDLKTFHIFNFK